MRLILSGTPSNLQYQLDGGGMLPLPGKYLVTPVDATVKTASAADKSYVQIVTSMSASAQVGERGQSNIGRANIFCKRSYEGASYNLFSLTHAQGSFQCASLGHLLDLSVLDPGGTNLAVSELFLVLDIVLL